MGAPKLYWYPEAAGPLQTCDLSGVCSAFTALEVNPVVERAEGVSQNGGRVVVVQRNSLRVRVYLRRFAGYTSAGQIVIRKLLALREHLRAGGVVVVAGNQSKAWCSFAEGSLSRGQTGINTRGELFGGALESAQAPAADDEIWIQGGWPGVQRELIKVSSYTSVAKKVSLAAGLDFSHTDPVFLYHRDFYVGLKLPQDQVGSPLLTDELRRAWTLDLELEQDGNLIQTLSSQGSSGWGTTSTWGDLDLESLQQKQEQLSAGGSGGLFGGKAEVTGSLGGGGSFSSGG